MCSDLAARIAGHEIQWEERGGRSTDSYGVIPFDGTPFIIIGRQLYECLYGRPRKNLSEISNDVSIVL